MRVLQPCQLSAAAHTTVSELDEADVIPAIDIDIQLHSPSSGSAVELLMATLAAPSRVSTQREDSRTNYHLGPSNYKVLLSYAEQPGFSKLRLS